MIITLSGNIASGKSTIGDALAKKLGFKRYSSGALLRQIATERGITLQELSELAEKNIEIDRTLDQRTVELSKKEDNFVIDSRLAWHFIPNCVKIYLYAGKKEQVRRIKLDLSKNRRVEEAINDNKGNKNKQNKSIVDKEILKSIKKREDSEKERYMKYYGINYHQKKHYDFWLNTDSCTVEECADQIIAFLKRKSLLS
jgi:cytidylate kinase